MGILNHIDRNLENEVKQQSAAVHRQKELIKKVERERDKAGEENQLLMEKIDKYKGTYISD